MEQSPQEGPPSGDGADVAAIQRIAAIPSILEVVCRVTGMGFAAVARVTDQRWIACAVRDEIAFGLQPGGELELSTTICNEIRGHHRPVVIDHVAADPAFRDHHTPRIYGLQSYISVPILRSDGSFFGTLCAIDTRPAKLSEGPALKTLTLFAEMIALQLEADERLRASEAELVDAHGTAELREQFIAVLGHDLRNPLAAIEGGMRLIGRTPLNDKARSILAMMETSTQRMAKLIDDVLDLARGRLDGGLTIKVQREADVETMLGNVINELRNADPDRQIEADIAIGQPVACDPARIAQLLSNLVGNALAHGEPRTMVRVRARCTADRFELSVTNRGETIPADRRERLFRPFTRGDRGNPNKGLGLGLYIAAQIARAHHGEIEVESADSETRFTLSMPLG